MCIPPCLTNGRAQRAFTQHVYYRCTGMQYRTCRTWYSSTWYQVCDTLHITLFQVAPGCWCYTVSYSQQYQAYMTYVPGIYHGSYASSRALAVDWAALSRDFNLAFRLLTHSFTLLAYHFISLVGNQCVWLHLLTPRSTCSAACFGCPLSSASVTNDGPPSRVSNICRMKGIARS